jgi:23S rRNA (cytosine1962-C5)-methyltransferase
MLDEAFERRRPILSDMGTTACRVFNGAGDGIDGLVIERLDEVLIVQCHEDRLALDEDQLRQLGLAAMKMLLATAVYRKVFPRDRAQAGKELSALHRDPQPWLGTSAAETLIVQEHGLRFAVRPYDGYAFGLFLDHRANRKRVRQLAKGKRVLNAFAYTCGFTVAAAVGGAVETISLDTSRRFLDWGRGNLELNGIPNQGHRFVTSDVIDYLKRAVRRRQRFDLIALDPPTFGRARGKRAFSLRAQLGELVHLAVDCLARDGWLLLSTNHRPTTRNELERAVTVAARGRELRSIERPSLPPDFRGDADYAKSILVNIG